MTNKHASKQHGLVNRGRPKSKLRNRKNKAKARLRRDVKQNLTTTAVKKAAPAKNAAPAKKETTVKEKKTVKKEAEAN